MRTIAIVISALLLSFCAASAAYAIGDSGGCGDVFNTPMGKALKAGSAADVEREIMIWVVAEEKQLDLKEKQGTFTSFFHSLFSRQPSQASTSAQRLQRRQSTILALIEGRHPKYATCRPGALLPIALLEENVEVVRYLTGTPLGVRPKIPAKIHFLCQHKGRYEDEDFRSRRRKAFDLVLRTGQVDINSKDDRGWTILQRCHEPDLIMLFVEHGARLDIASTPSSQPYNLLDLAVQRATDLDEWDRDFEGTHALENARIFARLVTDSIKGRPIEQRIRDSCSSRMNGVRHRNVKTCKELSTFVKATPGTFGSGDFW
jgi:hypothetical protein